ncbi:1-(5-phosphoribosyl)-5-[(5-phosphoribosylamino)methylideneamino]imidazole-4-carboxamide isomerase [Alkalibacillus haloalkaliphilus]|uniref:1-(5-phosphoribosyl)-5-[(5- phosphoribosylamino)methylideneamino]imidazole-4- carboxamide isomerase n=1 Tax=Alkalibacillus haloalkaliphilus TaxID=94136 RepID=UPI0029369916|nr:1-(5-phosphoribosyl)-5-[(5-phosphoribosylamino)methylideneamino]imidazole-4-carboxamide isomerase [Alkalibacillus haloalkaliphilus]MDV2583409.1 1-(5-phosphoribosyl)-5-[(5-phosphoribosylamino)methylideneamino]imidazole-4-carboxamide isomerase [Alkalibacillus haloalkaliphilus]
MRIFPAIDIRNQKCVRLKQGNYNEQTTYGDPVEMAQEWVDEGASFLHLVDLDAAKGDPSENLNVIKQIIDTVSIPVQVGGGVRSLERIEELIDIGVNRVILGTAAVKNPDFVKAAVDQFGEERIVVSVDARDGYVATDGWIETSDVEASQFAKQLEAAGVKTVVYTDISKDGMLEGPNFEALSDLNEQSELQVIASGGVSSLSDIQRLSELKLYGAIVGKALYEDQVKLSDIMKEPTTC